jgi:hypothetical protein
MTNFRSNIRTPFARPALTAAFAAALVVTLPACAADPPLTGVAPPTRIPDAPAQPPQLNQPFERVSSAVVPAEIRKLVVADAALYLRVAESAVVIGRAERVVWSDGSLGCPREGMGYIQTTQRGFRIVAKTSSQELVYHTDDRTDQTATVVRCTKAER